MGVRAAILGASGYSGGEVLRYLYRHPVIDVVVAAGGGKAGAAVADVHPHLLDVCDLTLVPLDEALSEDADLVISCLPHDRAVQFPSGTRVVDLSDRHRADPSWAYGLPEFFRDDVTQATRVANPGCYPTATSLAVVPFAKAGLIEGPVIVDAMSGTSGAGKKGEDHLLHAAADSAIGAYGAVAHRHVPEMERVLTRGAGSEMVVSFTPHLVPMSRGLLVTARAALNRSASDEEVLEVLRTAYAAESFVSVTAGWPSTKSVAGTNRAIVSARVDQRAGMVICSAAIDNLGKGAAGQAIQNANLMLGLDEATGLEAVAVAP